MLLEKCSFYCRQMIELKRDQSVVFGLLIWQYCLNLSGATSDPLHIQGDVLTDQDQFVKENRDNAPLMTMIHTFHIRLNVIFCEYEGGARLFRDHGYDWPKAAPGHALFMEAVFCGGVCCFVSARQTGNRKDRKYAMKARATIKGWIRQNNPNIAHHEALLDAEYAALRKKHKEAERCYQSAISISTRDGVLHDAALSNERYADFLLSTNRANQAKAPFYLKEAIKLYSEWGSFRKAKQLQESFSFILVGDD